MKQSSLLQILAIVFITTTAALSSVSPQDIGNDVLSDIAKRDTQTGSLLPALKKRQPRRIQLYVHQDPRRPQAPPGARFLTGEMTATLTRLAQWLVPQALQNLNFATGESPAFHATLDQPPRNCLGLPRVGFRNVRPDVFLHMNVQVVLGQGFPELNRQTMSHILLQNLDQAGQGTTLPQMITDRIGGGETEGRLLFIRRGSRDVVSLEWYLGTMNQPCTNPTNDDELTIPDPGLPQVDANCPSALCDVFSFISM